MVVDIGGGTSDCSLLAIKLSHDKNKQIKYNITVKSITGVSHFGGQDINKQISKIVLKKSGINLNELKEQERADVNSELFKLSETLKKRLSKYETASIRERIHGDYTKITMKRTELESSISSLLQPVKKQLEECIGEEKIDEVMVIGGSADCPIIQKMVKDSLKEDCHWIISNHRRDLASRGAAVINMLRNTKLNNIMFSSVIAFNIGVKCNKDRFEALVKKHRCLPISDAFTGFFNVQ